MQPLVVGLAMGFPVVIVSAWALEVTAGRTNRAPSAPGGAESVRGVRLGALLVGLGVLAAAPGLAWYFLLRPLGWPATASRTGPADPPLASSAQLPSIAVLPFTDMSATRGDALRRAA